MNAQGFLKRVAALFLIFFTGPLSAEEITMSARLNFTYNMTLQAENMFLRLYINGAPIVYHGRTSKMLFTYPMTEFLRTGKNRIDIDYEPFNLTTQTYTPHKDVTLQIGLRQLKGAEYIGEVDLFSGRYNVEAAQLLEQETLVYGGTKRSTKGGLITAPGSFSSLPVDMQYSSRKSSVDARRISFDFNIDDPSLLVPPWVDAPVLSDTPEMRRALWQGYKTLHDVTAQRSQEGYLEIMSPTLTRGAYILGYDNNAALAERIFEFSPLGGPANTTLKPLLTQEAIMSAHLRWSSDNRMVRVFDDPITFLDASGNKVGAYRVLFCQQSDGTFRVCHQMDIPY